MGQRYGAPCFLCGALGLTHLAVDSVRTATARNCIAFQDEQLAPTKREGGLRPPSLTSSETQTKRSSHKSLCGDGLPSNIRLQLR